MNTLFLSGQSGENNMVATGKRDNSGINNHPTRHIYMVVEGDAMINAGIKSGDTIIVDRSIKAKSGKIVIAVLNDGMLIRRYEQSGNRIRLLPETASLAPIEVDTRGCRFYIFGVVTHVVRRV